MRGSGQREDQGSVQLLRLGRQHRLGVVEEARELRLNFGTAQSGDEPQGRALHAEVGDTQRLTRWDRVSPLQPCGVQQRDALKAPTTDAAGSGWSGEPQPGCAGD